MADFSPSGYEATGLPSQTLDSLRQGGDPRVLGWLREAVTEGDFINRADPDYDRMSIGMQYVSGNQISEADAAKRPGYLSNLTINESRRVVQAHVSALTDLKPLFAYKSLNPAFAEQADLINKLTVAWWITEQADIELGDVVKYALAAGTGDCVVEWNPYLGMGGDMVLSARDARDTLAIRPPTSSRNIQSWDGLILREAHTVNAMKGLFPTQAHLFRPTSDSLLSSLMGRMRTIVSRFVSPAGDTLAGLNAPAVASRMRTGEILLYRTYLTDRSRNLTTNVIPMGTPGSSWAYTVRPGEYLYPYKRLIVATPEAVLYDGPNTYWHGQFPVSRLKLWNLPWQFLGKGLLSDLQPIQDAINSLAQDVLLGIKKWMDPSVVYNRGAVSEAFMRVFDPRRPGAKIKLTQEGVKEGFKLQEGPPAQVLSLAMQMTQLLLSKFDDLSGTPNLQELLALRQLPGADTIQRYWEALTPELRQEGRQLEAFLRPIAEQAKYMRFQYESNARRVQILGDAGAILSDFDFDPAQMVPALTKGQPGYTPELDASLPRDQRARAFARSIVFTMAPNSILAINSQEKKMIAMQNFRMGVLDFWSYHEAMETPNVGAPPAIPLPPLQPIDPLMMQQMLSTPEGLMEFQQKYTLDPMSGQILELRVPITVTERLLAQNMLGIGTAAGPAAGEGPPGGASGGSSGPGGGRGRPASGQSTPKMEQKSDGRTTVTESNHSKGPNSR